ncbi:hypothetical protein J3R82DRAFT_3318 [Butyriboletus roseoflavus]|nr:hypothetical protein J3R82DRAFT_3318 [Butyriboletus roseoflavus]
MAFRSCVVAFRVSSTLPPYFHTITLDSFVIDVWFREVVWCPINVTPDASHQSPSIPEKEFTYEASKLSLRHGLDGRNPGLELRTPTLTFGSELGCRMHIWQDTVRVTNTLTGFARACPTHSM